MYKKNDTLPTIAIIGKPNVGKSSLFNRLIRRRKAIVAPDPGVTRDINYETLDIDEYQVNLADSAGVTRDFNDVHALTQKYNRTLIHEASLILFTCDIRNLDADDFEIAKLVRKSGKPALLVLNKADTARLGEDMYDFYSLGFNEPLPVSALHGRGISLLLEKIRERLSDIVPYRNIPLQIEDSRTIDVAIVGRPNVGKSSLLNLLAEMERSLVTPVPGTTRDSVDQDIHFSGYTFHLIDTAGMRRKRSVSENIEYYSLVRTKEAIKKATVVLLLIDAGKGIIKQDKKIADIVVQEKKALIIVANKWDTITREEREFIQDVYDYFPHISFAGVLPFSAQTGYNKTKLLKKIIKVYNNYHKNIKTPQVNEFIQSLVKRQAVVKYGIQRKSGPPEFEFFVRHLQNRTNFTRYVTNALRKHFDFEGVPISIVLREK